MNKSDRCDRCPDEDTNVCDACNPNEDTSDQDKLMTEISDKFFTLRSAVRKRYFGDKTNDDIKQISLELSEKSKELAESLPKKTETEKDQMDLTYKFTISGGIYEIDGLHRDLDYIVMAAGADVGYILWNSSLESSNEITEHDYMKGAKKDE